MSSEVSRRQFISSVGALAASHAVSSLPVHVLLVQAKRYPPIDLRALDMKSSFRVAVINDEITQDFGRACEIASRDFGMGWIELRSMWNKNILQLDSKEIEEARKILGKNPLRVTDIASPLFKADWPGAPRSKFSLKGDQFKADFTFQQQDEVLERSMELAKAFGTDRVRCFDFWRLDDQKPYRAAIDEKLAEAANKVGKKGLLLVLENEPSCNTATGVEAARTLEAVRSPYLMLNWDPGNAATYDEIPYPDAYERLPKHRIAHCHCKDVVKTPDGQGQVGKGYECVAMGHGMIDWVGQFKALKRDGYRYAVSLETHWRGAGTAEESTRQSWEGMKNELQKAGAL